MGHPATATAVEAGRAPEQSAVTVEGRFDSRDAARPPASYPEPVTDPVLVASAAHPSHLFEEALDEHPDQLFSALELDFFKRADDLYTQAVSDGESWDDLEPAHASPPARTRMQ